MAMQINTGGHTSLPYAGEGGDFEQHPGFLREPCQGVTVAPVRLESVRGGGGSLDEGGGSGIGEPVERGRVNVYRMYNIHNNITTMGIHV